MADHQEATHRFEELAAKWLNKTITDVEREEFSVWYNANQDESLDVPEHIAKDEEEHKQKIFASINKSIQKQNSTKVRLWPKLTAAAAILIIAGTSLYFFNTRQPISNEQQVQHHQEILPGSNKAFLTLTNGKVILLNDQKNGEITEQSGIKVSKTDDGQLIYSIKAKGTSGKTEVAFNTIETPKGGQYQVVLPDGTKVWLNAATKLHYPIRFNKNNRIVELEGEAYFEVSKNKARPFIVQTKRQKVEVLGTHFNINSYSNEEAVKTTLLEGSVKVFAINSTVTNKNVLLVRGEQAVLAGNNISVKSVDVEQAVAWKNGFFQFYHTDLKSVMRQVSRWYNIDVVYDGKTPTKEFSGKIQRNVTANELVEALNFSGIRCEIKNDKIVVKL
ncbi:transmembrane sensor [Pedobacter sp. UYEF25]